MDSNDIVTEKSISFLRSIFDSTKHIPRHAYTLSMLPYPKDTIKEVLKKYISSCARDGFDGSLECALGYQVIKGLYLSLADFMNDTDAEFVNNIWNVADTNPHFENSSERKQYDILIEIRENEREQMNKEIDAVIPSLG